MLATPGRIKTAQRRKVRVRLPPPCGRCGATEGLTLDYITPRVYGGSNNSAACNCCVCGLCHSAKSKQEVRHRHPAANRKAGEKLRKKLAAAQAATASFLRSLVEAPLCFSRSLGTDLTPQPLFLGKGELALVLEPSFLELKTSSPSFWERELGVRSTPGE